MTSLQRYRTSPLLVLWTDKPVGIEHEPDIKNSCPPQASTVCTRNDFVWTEVHESAFQNARKALTTAPTLTYFDLGKETRLHTHASRLGIGFVLSQRAKDSDEEWKTVQAGSRFLTDTETRYAVIELECLAVAWAVKRCHIFLSGIDHFTVVTDQNSLIPLLNSYRLDEIENLRLQRIRTRLMAYNLTAQWLKGTKRRMPYRVTRVVHDLAEYNTDCNLAPSLAPFTSQIRTSASHQQDIESLQLHELRGHAADDQEYQILKETIISGFHNDKACL